MRRLRPLLAFLAAALALLLPVSAASAEERIRYFLSDVEVAPDGTLHVTETIRVQAEGYHVQRGILRDFPTRYEQNGRRVRVGFEVEDVTRNGAPEPWSTERIGNGVRVRIGDADYYLPAGVHEYAIRYRTTRQLGFFDGYDELYWSATGTDWTLPIELAEARIRLPEPAPFGARAAYTGPYGSRESNAAVVAETPGEILFRTTAPLAPGEGLTVAAAFPKGVVAEPPPRSAASLWLERRAPAIAAAIGLAATLAFYFFAWAKAGRGPRAGPVVPLFSPPDGMSAAALRFVRKMGFDNRAFAAALIEAGVRGKLRMEEGEGGLFKRGKTTLHKIEPAADLPAPERAMFNRLFHSRSRIVMENKNHKAFQEARARLKLGLDEEWRGVAFERHYDWAFAGALLMAAAALVAGAVLFAVDPFLGAGLALIPLGGLAAMFVAWRLAVRGGIAAAVFAGIFGTAGLIALFVTAVFAGEEGRALPVLLPFLALPVAISSFWWMSAPTREGRLLMDRIAGFRHYLAIAEEDRLEALHPPEKTPELFERYLPHAIALGVENRWAGKFESVLARAAATQGRESGHMHWYSGRHSPWSNPGRFATAVGAGLASSVASASSAPGSSSGSGGGGFSGGGGGGGGGSGW